MCQYLQQAALGVLPSDMPEAYIREWLQMSSCRLVLGFRIGETPSFLCAKSAGLLFQPLTSMGKPHRIVPVFHFLSCTSFCRLHRQLSYRCCGRSTLCIVANHALILETDLPISTLHHCTKSFEQAVVNAVSEKSANCHQSNRRTVWLGLARSETAPTHNQESSPFTQGWSFYDSMPKESRDISDNHT